ncbi:MAG TPA: asparagine synthase C-terminal domain-containing protein, partial [Rhizobiaceae bacterium]|nr:asparagine synthase C-terminal domain-containing protein [Rhizobiaceae bacterium]
RTLLEAARTAFMPRWLRTARAWTKRLSPRNTLPQSAICSAGFARRTSLLQRLAESRSRPARLLNFAEERAQTITDTHLVVGRERYDRVASALAIEPRDPYLDLRLVRFCLSLPGDQLERDGWPKFILRKAMAANLPAEVCWRLGKDSLGWDFVVALARQEPVFVPNEQRLAKYVDDTIVPPIGPIDNSDISAKWLSKVWFAKWLQRYGRYTREAGALQWKKVKSRKKPKNKEKNIHLRN